MTKEDLVRMIKEEIKSIEEGLFGRQPKESGDIEQRVDRMWDILQRMDARLSSMEKTYDRVLYKIGENRNE